MNVRAFLFISALTVAPALGLAEEPPAQKAATSSATAESVTTGVFTGIEQGDYAYLKVRTADGAEDSFMILNDGGGLKKFVEKPKKLIGKKIRVRWQEREENIPEAGGRIKVRVALGAEKLQ